MRYTEKYRYHNNYCNHFSNVVIVLNFDAALALLDLSTIVLEMTAGSVQSSHFESLPTNFIDYLLVQ